MAIDIAQLGLEVRSDGVVVSTKRLEELEKTATKAESASERLTRQADKMSKQLTGAGRGMQSLGKSMSLYITAPMVAAGLAAVKLAVDAEETANKFAVVFRGSIERAEAALAELTKTIPLTVTEMKGLAAGVQDMLVPMGLARSEAADLSIEAVKLAGDLASFNNVGADQVLRDIGSALAGQSEPLRKYGIDVSKAKLESIALAEGLIDVGESLDKAAEAQAIFIAITNDSADAMGDAARTVESTANQARFLKRDLKQLSEDIGRDLIPVFMQFLGIVREGVDYLKEMSPEARDTALRIAAITAAVGPLLIGLGGLLRVLGTLVPWIVRLGVLLGPAGAVAVGLGILVKLVGDAYVAKLEAAIIGTERFTTSLEELKTVAGLQSNLDAVNEELERLVDNREALILKMQALEAMLNDTEALSQPGAPGLMRAELERLQKQLDMTNKFIANHTKLRDSYVKKVEESTEAVTEETAALEELSSVPPLEWLATDTEALAALLDTIDPVTKAVEEFTAARELLGKALETGEIGLPEFERLLKLLQQSTLAAAAFGKEVAKKRDFDSGIQKELDASEDYLDHLVELGDAIEGLRYKYDPLNSALEDLAAERALVQEAFDEKLIDESTFDTLIAGIDKATVQLENMDDTFERAMTDWVYALGEVAGLFEQDSQEAQALNAIMQVLNIVMGINAVIKQLSEGDVYSAIPRAVAVAAMVASLGVQTGANGSAVATRTRQESQGTGSVLGDAEAKSESILNAMEITADATSSLVGINKGMLHALQSLQTGLTGAITQIARGASGNVALPEAGSLGLLGDVLTGSGFFNLGGLNFVGEFINKLLGGKVKLLDEGIQIDGGSLTELINKVLVRAFADIDIKKNIFDDWDLKTKFEELDAAVGDQLSLVFASLRDTVEEAAIAIGIPLDTIQERLAAFQIETIKISTMDLTAEEAQAELLAVFSKIFDDLAVAVIPFIGQFQKVGEGLGETLVRVATSIQVFQEAVSMLGLSIDVTDPERMAQISVGLIEMAGGVEEFISQLQNFIGKFATDEWKNNVAIDAVTRAFEQLDIALPGTREELWALVQGLDLTTEAGQRQLTAILDLTDSLDVYYNALDEVEERRVEAAEAEAAALEYTRLSVEAVTEAAELLGFTVDAIDATQLATFSEALVEMVGGIDLFSAQVNSFFDAFASDEDKIAAITKQMEDAFASVGLTVPDAASGMWELMNTIDATTEAGREQIAMLLGITDVASRYYAWLEQAEQERLTELTDEIRRAEDLADEMAAVAAAIAAAAQAHRELMQTVADSLNKLGIASGNIDTKAFWAVADSLIEMAGGIDIFTQQANSFFSSFAPDEVQTAAVFDEMNAAFAAMGMTVPRTTAELWALMNTLDANTEAGQEQIITLLGLIDTANRYYAILDQQEADRVSAAAAAQRELEDAQRAAEAAAAARQRAREEREAARIAAEAELALAMEYTRQSIMAVEHASNILGFSRKGIVMFTEALVDMVGGFENLTNLSEGFFQAFASDERKLLRNINEMQKAFGTMGLEIPDTRDELYRLMKAQDANTEAGRRNIVMLLNLTDIANQYYTNIETAEAARIAAEEAAAAAALSAAERAAAEAERLAIEMALAMNYTRSSIDAVTRAADLLGFSAAGVEDFSEILVILAGSIENVVQLSQSFFNTFANDEQKASRTVEDMQKAFAAMGLEIPATRDGMLELMAAQDANTEAGRRNIAILWELIATGNAYYTNLEAAEAERIRAEEARIAAELAAEEARVAEEARIAAELAEAMELTRQTILAVVDAADLLGFSKGGMYAFSEALVELVGGLDQFVSLTKSYFDAFASEEQKAAKITADMQKAFTDLGLTIPDTRNGMLDLMASLDGTTEAGREQIAMLLGIADTADQYYKLVEAAEKDRLSAAEDQAKELERIAEEQARLEAARVAEMAALNNTLLEQQRTLSNFTGGAVNNALQQLRDDFIAAVKAADSLGASQKEYSLIAISFDRQLKRMAAELRLSIISMTEALFGNGTGAITDGLEQTNQVAATVFDEWQRALTSLRDFTKSILLNENLTTLTPAQQLAEAQAQFDKLMADAQGGSAEAAAALPGAAQALLEEARFMYASGQQYTDIFDKTLTALDSIGTPAGVKPTIETVGPPADTEKTATQVLVDELQRFLQATDLASTLRDLSQVLNTSVIQLAGELSIPLEELVTILGVDLENLNETTAAGLAEVASILGANVFELIDTMGIGLRELAAVSGVSIDNMSQALASELGSFAAALGVSVIDLTTAMNISIADLAATFGIGVDKFSAEQFSALVSFSNALGLSLAQTTTALGIELGKIEDANSMLSQILDDAIAGLPEGIQADLGPLLLAIQQATTVADANASVQELGDYILSLPDSFAQVLQPFLSLINYNAVTPELNALNMIQRNTAQTTSAIYDLIVALNANRPLGAFADGGTVDRTGLYQMHAGEFVVTQSANNLSVTPTNGDEMSRSELAEIRTVLIDIREQNRRYQESSLTTTRGMENTLRQQTEQRRRVANG